MWIPDLLRKIFPFHRSAPGLEYGFNCSSTPKDIEYPNDSRTPWQPGSIEGCIRTSKAAMKAVERKLPRLPHLPSWFIDIHSHQPVGQSVPLEFLT
jgi:hypothetical protein